MITGIVDVHVHAAPSLLPRRYTDPEMAQVAKAAGLARWVLKAHHGSSVERAALAGPQTVGGVVLNSPVGGANPDAVAVAASLGGRLVWMPTISAAAHIAAHSQAALSVHRNLAFSPVPVCEGDALRSEWIPVLDLIAAHDLVLGSGHISMDETLCLFKVAVSRGVKRLLINHPLMPFLGWREEHSDAFSRLGARLEIGVLADHLSETEISPTQYLASRYPAELLLFGSDLGHTSFPDYQAGIKDWIARVEPILGQRPLEEIMTSNGQALLGL